jgi:alkylation response protein AidB-like acyl-CoA dehydrogenase
MITSSQQQILNILCSFTVGCKTEDGLTVILVERGPGVETRQIKTSYSTTAGTAYITFDNVRVPVENTLGEEGKGIFVILRCVTMVYDVRLEHSFMS